MPSHPHIPFDVPVVFIVFNRPTVTRKTFEQIALMQPRKLFLIADGPREHRPAEKELCEEVRSIVTAVDWPCDVQTNFADANMGCRDRIVSGLDWVFEQVDRAVILEDDILPDLSFFPFCEQLLERYKDDDRISMISGFSIVEDKLKDVQESYIYSCMSHIWGWGTWSRSWKRYDPTMKSWPAVRDSGLLQELFPVHDHEQYWTKLFSEMHAGTGPNTWDIQWFYANLIDSLFSIVPCVNLIQNLGFGADATHTKHEEDNVARHVGTMPFPLVSPVACVPRHSLDQLDLQRSGCVPLTLPRRIWNKLKRMWIRRRFLSPTT